MTEQAPNDITRDLLAFIQASPTPEHCVVEAARRLDERGFVCLDERDRWPLEAGGGYYAIRGGAIIAFRVGTASAPEAGFRLLGAHTDSPSLRVKPLPAVETEGFLQLGVEVYGGLLDYSWLDRDLGLAGPVMLAGEGDDAALERRLVRIDRPLLRVPSLAIHLNREIRESGLKLDAQKHLPPVLGLTAKPDGGDASKDKEAPDALRQLLARELDVAPERILSWELSVVDIVPPTLGGLNDEFIFAPRLDNQAMCHAELCALFDAETARATQVVCLNDHEEVGSSTVSGAAGAFVEDVLRRVAEVDGPGAEPGGLMRAAPRSFQVSADMAHAVHPNYADRHEPQHKPHLNRGPVIKINTQQRYATSAEGSALFEALCKRAEVPYQKFVNRTDLPCGSTIGPISSTRFGIRTVDVGNPMLSMHSIREQAGAHDPPHMVRVLTLFLETEALFA